jgi:hypothetical protein
MRKTMFVLSLLLASLVYAPASYAQDNQNAQPPAKAAEPVHYYHLTFVVQELGADGKPTNSRTYITTINTDPHTHPVHIRTDSKVPMGTSTTQYTVTDLAIKFDVSDVREVGHQISMNVVASVDSLGASDPVLHPPFPIIRQNSWDGTILIPTGKPTVIFTSDTLDSKGAMQVVATATPIP